MVRACLPLVSCCLLLCGCGPAVPPPGEHSPEGVSDELGTREGAGTCAANPRSQLVVTDQAPVVRAFASNGSSVVYQRWDGRYPFVLAHVSTGRRTGPLGQFITYSADERRALFWSESGAVPTRLLDVSAATGATSVILEGEVDTAWPIAERRAVLLLDGDAPSWVYFTDTRELRQLSPLPLNRSGVTLSNDETLVVFRAGTELRFVDVLSRSTGTLSSGASGFQLIHGQRRVLFWDTRQRLWYWTPEGGGVLLDSNPRAVSTSVAGEVLWVDAEDRVRLWRPASGTVETVATGAEWAWLSASGNRITFVRQAGSSPRALVARDLASGQEQLILETDKSVGGYPSDDGRFIAFSEQVTEDSSSVRLWDFSSAAEIPLSETPAVTYYGLYLSFHQAGAVLEVVAVDREVLLYDTSSGAMIYRTDRSVVSGEGEFSYWSPAEGFFFTPVGGYGDRPFDLYAFRPSRRRENFVGRLVWPSCFVGERLVFFHDVVGGDPVSFGQLATWDPWARQRWELSPTGGDTSCLSHKAAVVFREDVQPDPELFNLEVGTLVYASLPKQRRTVLGGDVNAYVVHRHRLMYSDSRSICIVRF